MPIIIEERQESRDTTGGDNPSVDLKYWIKGTSDDLVAKAMLQAYSPLFYPSAGIGALVRQNYSVTPIGPDLWENKVAAASGSISTVPWQENRTRDQERHHPSDFRGAWPYTAPDQPDRSASYSTPS